MALSRTALVLQLAVLTLLVVIAFELATLASLRQEVQTLQSGLDQTNSYLQEICKQGASLAALQGGATCRPDYLK